MPETRLPLRNGPPQSEPEADLELDENNQPVHPGLTWQNAGTEIPQRMADAVAPSLPKYDPAQVQLALMRVRNEVDQKAIPAAHWAKQNVPGMEQLSYALTYRQRVKDAEDAKAAQRQPVQMEREFSSEEEKQRYLDKVRQAMANAKK